MEIEALYHEYKTPLFSLAYRMLGSVMDAEDVVQDAFLSYDQLPDRSAIRNERAYLYKIVTNRCLDLLRSSARKRELYVGPWLPEPLIDNGSIDPSDEYLQRESISTAYLLLLQQLGAVERAVFLLREIFHYSFGEISEIVGKSSVNCRQIFHRARNSIHFDPAEHPPLPIAEEKVKAFVNSMFEGNMRKLLELVGENVVMYSDGGGKVKVAQVPVAGFDLVFKLIQNLLKMYEGRFALDFLLVNGSPGLMLVTDDGDRHVYSFAFRHGKIRSIYSVANPDKLRHL
jgi:RNA polymerase sigma-70 factor (ECF subfamily)